MTLSFTFVHHFVEHFTAVDTSAAALLASSAAAGPHGRCLKRLVTRAGATVCFGYWPKLLVALDAFKLKGKRCKVYGTL